MISRPQERPMSNVFAAGLALIVAASPAGAMTVTSPDIKPGGTIGLKHVYNAETCVGENVPPLLAWSGVPPNAKALAITAFDPDAPRPEGWVHWVVTRIPPGTTSSAHLGTAVSGPTDFGKPGYNGPCPPPGDKPHRYVFTVYALDTDLPFDARTTYAQFTAAIRGHVLVKATLTGRYGR
jgi:Raf kinase inhibitor-like YbhB/YbcL family protein